MYPTQTIYTYQSLNPSTNSSPFPFSHAANHQTIIPPGNLRRGNKSMKRANRSSQAGSIEELSSINDAFRLVPCNLSYPGAACRSPRRTGLGNEGPGRVTNPPPGSSCYYSIKYQGQRKGVEGTAAGRRKRSRDARVGAARGWGDREKDTRKERKKRKKARQAGRRTDGEG